MFVCLPVSLCILFSRTYDSSPILGVYRYSYAYRNIETNSASTGTSLVLERAFKYGVKSDKILQTTRSETR